MNQIKVNTQKVKILALDFWHHCEIEDGTHFEDYIKRNSMTEIMPIFNRDGQYFCRQSKTYWFEIQGKAYQKENQIEIFKFELSLFNHRRLRQVEFDAIKVLLRQQICPKELGKKVHLEEFFRHSWSSQIEMHKGFLRAKREMEQEGNQ